MTLYITKNGRETLTNLQCLLFCPTCNYAILKTELKQLIANPRQTPCPRCNQSSLSNFYSYGSDTHHAIRRARLLEHHRLKTTPPRLQTRT